MPRMPVRASYLGTPTPDCEECGAPHGEELPDHLQMPGREHVRVFMTTATHRNHAARGRYLCEDCERAFDRECDQEG
jgi:hypothetical protein